MKKKLLLLPICLLAGCTSLTKVSANGEIKGLYDEEYDPINVPLNDGLVDGYESVDSFYYSTRIAYFYQHKMNYSLSLNEDKTYVTEGNKSMEIVYDLPTFVDPAIYPSLYFSIPNPDNDFSSSVSFSFDYCNKSEVDLEIYIWCLGQFMGAPYVYKYALDKENTKGDKLILEKGNEMRHFEITLNVDFGKYDDGETQGGADIPRNIKYIRMCLPQDSSKKSQIDFLLDNVKISK